MASLACWVPLFLLCPVANLMALRTGHVGPQVWIAIALQLLLLSIAQMGFGRCILLIFFAVKSDDKCDRCHILVYYGICTKQTMPRSGQWPRAECGIGRACTESDNDSALISEHEVQRDGWICLLLLHDGFQHCRFLYGKKTT